MGDLTDAELWEFLGVPLGRPVGLPKLLAFARETARREKARREAEQRRADMATVITLRQRRALERGEPYAVQEGVPLSWQEAAAAWLNLRPYGPIRLYPLRARVTPSQARAFAEYIMSETIPALWWHEKSKTGSRALATLARLIRGDL